MTLKRFGDLKPGDRIIGADGQPTTVTEAYEAHIPVSMWEIELDDGSVMKVSGNHLWYCETKLDWELYAIRKKKARKVLSSITPGVLRLLEETAAKDVPVETSLADLVTLLRAGSKPEVLEVVVRVAESIGHVAEQTVTFDALDGDSPDPETVRMYDARRFATQILALTGIRRWKDTQIIIGSVLTTEEMIELSDSIELPVVQPIS